MGGRSRHAARSARERHPRAGIARRPPPCRYTFHRRPGRLDNASHMIRIHTDGACRGNPGPGGWAWASGPDEFSSGAEAHTTNQRMEVIAVIEALHEHPDGAIEIVSDSNYVVKCFHDKWYVGWLRRNWK